MSRRSKVTATYKPCHEETFHDDVDDDIEIVAPESGDD